MENVIYAKYSRERRKDFQISTYILENENGEKSVVKMALYPEKPGHVLAMAENYEKLRKMYQGVPLQVCPCEKRDEKSVRFPYIEGQNMDQFLTKHIEAKEYEKVKSDIRFLWDILSTQPGLTNFRTSEQFEKIFGKMEIDSELLASPVSNLDFVFSNILVGEEYVLTDYEWVFDFMIPIRFLFARSLLLHGKFQTLDQKQQEELYGIGGVKLEDLPAYHRMEENFQKYVTGQDELYVLSKLYPRLETHNYFLKNWDTKNADYTVKLLGIPRENPENPITLFSQQYVIGEKEIKEIVAIPDSSSYSQLVLLPTDCEVIMKFHSVTGRRKSQKEWETVPFSEHNARLNYGQEYMFQEPPRLIIENREYEEIQFSYILYHQKNYLVREEIEFRAENEKLHRELGKYTGSFPRRVARKVCSILKK